MHSGWHKFLWGLLKVLTGFFTSLVPIPIVPSPQGVRSALLPTQCRIWFTIVFEPAQYQLRWTGVLPRACCARTEPDLEPASAV